MPARAGGGLADMEHAIIGLIELLLWLDRRSLKPLDKAVPNLEGLYRDPEAVLAEEEVSIGPARRYASSLGMGLLCAVPGWVLGLFVLVEMNPRGRGWPPWACAALLLTVCLGILLASVWLMLRLFRGGTAVLKPDGVELRYRKKVVWCPWALFDTPGQPFRPGRDRILLPVAAGAVPFVEARRDGKALARGLEVRTRQLRFKSSTQAVLKDFYEVDAGEVGAFLLGLGRRLGAAVPGGPAPPPDGAESAPAAAPVPDEEGWITVSVTRLELPPFCSECGTHTTSTQAVRGYASLLRVGRFLDVQGGECVSLRVPVCPSCRKANRRLWRRVFGKRLAAGVLVPFLLGLAASLAFQDPAAMALALPLAVVGAPLGGWSGVRAAKRRTAPVRVRYFPRDGTVALHFRQPKYAEAVLALLEGQQEWRHSPTA